MKKLVLVLPLVAFVCFGCSGVDREDVAVPVSDRVPDLTDETRGLTTKFYDSDNAYTKEVRGKLAKNPAVQAELARFEAEGYVLSPSGSFVTEGDDRTGRHVEIAVLSLANALDTRGGINLFCIGGAAATEIGAFRLTSDEAVAKREGHERIGDGVWWGLIESSVDRTESDRDPHSVWNWRRWGRCVGGGIAQAATECAYICLAVPAYTHCVLVCTGVRAGAVLINCSIEEL